MVPVLLRRPVQLVLVLLAVGALIAVVVVVAPFSTAGFAQAVAGTADVPPIDGDPTDQRDRHVVSLDAALLLRDGAGNAEEPSPEQLIRPGRATARNGDADTPAPLSTPRAAVPAPRDDADLATALAASDPRIDEVTPVGGGRYAVVSDGLGTDGLGAVRGVVDVEVDPLAFAAAVDPRREEQWSLANAGDTVEGVVGRPGGDIGWGAARAVATGEGVVVAVLDSGIAPHPDLPALWQNVDDDCDDGVADTGSDDDGNGYTDDCAGWDFVNDDNMPYDEAADNTHGTAVAGVIAGLTDNGVGIAGVAPDAQLMSLKILEGGSFPLSRAAAAIRYAADNGADVINASWTTAPDAGGSTVLAEAVEYARLRGVLIVASAGNQGVNIDHQPVLPAAYSDANVLTVGASDASDHVTAFSNYGAKNVDLFAPGQSILTMRPGAAYGLAHGTSMAAPLAAGVAALVIEHRRGHGQVDTPLSVRNAIRDGVVPDAVYAGISAGAGRLDAPRALGLAVPLATDELRASFTGLGGLQPGPISATATIRAGAAVADLEMTLAVLRDGAVHAVAHHLHAVGDPDGTRRGRTTGMGELGLDGLSPDDLASLSGPEGLELTISTELPEGRYALMVGARSTGGAESVPVATVFIVGDPDAVGGPGDDDPDEGDGSTTPDPGSGDETDAPDDGEPGGDGTEGDGESERDFDTEGPGGDLDIPGTEPPEPTESPTEANEDGGGTEAPTEQPTEQGTGSEHTDPIGVGDGPPDSDTDGGSASPPAEPPAPQTPLCADAPSHEAVVPNCGDLGGGTIVHVRGDFDGAFVPEHVLFGGQSVTVVTASDTYVLVMTRPHLPGTVDVTVVAANGSEVAYPESYTFLDPEGADDGSGGGADDGNGGDDTDGADTDTGDTGTDDGADIGDPSEIAPEMADNGLTLTALGEAHPLSQLRAAAWTERVCTASGPCTAMVLRS